MLAGAGFAVLAVAEHHFTPEGYTALWLLGESHLAVHTFPEHGTSYLELASCMLDKYTHFIHALEGWLTAEPPASAVFTVTKQ